MSAISSGEWQRNADQRGRMSKFNALVAGVGAPVFIALSIATEQWPFVVLAGLVSLYLLPAWFYFSAHRICLRARDNAKQFEEQAVDPSDSLRARLTAFARDCITHGDMTPTAERMLHQILEES